MLWYIAAAASCAGRRRDISSTFYNYYKLSWPTVAVRSSPLWLCVAWGRPCAALRTHTHTSTKAQSPRLQVRNTARFDMVHCNDYEHRTRIFRLPPVSEPHRHWSRFHCFLLIFWSPVTCIHCKLIPPVLRWTSLQHLL